MQRVFVTGGCGFLGIPLVRGLLEKGYRVSIIDTAPLDEPLYEQVEFTQGDVCDSRLLGELCRGVDYVIHNAAILPVSRSKKKILWDVNVRGTRNVFEAALQSNVKKVIFISSSAPYGIPKSAPIRESTPFNPVCDYGRSKIAAEGVCNEYRAKGLDIVILRPRTIVGQGRLGLFQILYSWIADNKNIYIIGSGNNLFQIISEEDMVAACILSIEKVCTNQDFNLGMKKCKTVREDLSDLIRYAQSTSKIISIPAPFARCVLGFLDFLNLVPFTAWHYKTPDKAFYFDSIKAQTMLGWEPTQSSLDVFRGSYDWYLQRRREIDSQFGTTHRTSIKQKILRLLKKFS
ncbi:MAG: NAD(P)-dependent oxidoreductase, partial [Candidatus Omnitrophica bacterium]|nr:NAD(P)-dependent oxidoreductase [Candidatus Omnitrophota bacterium]